MVPRPVLVYDGDCGGCTRLADLARRWSHDRLAIQPWQRADLDSLGLERADCERAVQLVDEHGRCSGAQAVARALAYCPVPGPMLGRAMSSAGLAPLAERVYAWVAAHRHVLPRSTSACRVDA